MRPCQGRSRGFESRFPLQLFSERARASEGPRVILRRRRQEVRQRSAKPPPPVQIRAAPPISFANPHIFNGDSGPEPLPLPVALPFSRASAPRALAPLRGKVYCQGSRFPETATTSLGVLQPWPLPSRLCSPEIRRLFGVAPSVCATMLRALVMENFLSRTGEGVFVRSTTH